MKNNKITSETVSNTDETLPRHDSKDKETAPPEESVSLAPKSKHWIERKWFVRALALVLSLSCWFVANASNTNINFSYTVENVPIKMETAAESLSRMNLSIIEIIPNRVTANLRGDRSTIAGLDPAALAATLEVNTEVNGPGTYKFSLVSSNPANTSMASLYQIVSYSPEVLLLKLDELKSVTKQIELVFTGDSSVPEGMIRESETITPSRIQITGPQNELDKIDRCVVEVNFDQPLDKTSVVDYPIVLLDAEGKEITPEQKHLLLDHNTAQVAIRVLKKNEIVLNVEFTNIPRGLDEADIRYTMSNYEVAVAGPADAVDRFNELVVAYIDVQSISKIQNDFVYNLKLPEGFVNLENLKTVTVSFDTSDWIEKSFVIPKENIRFLNTNNKYDVSLVTEALYEVLFIGEKEVVESLDLEDIVVEVDLSERPLTLGQYQHLAHISAPNNGFLWATGEYFVVINVKDTATE